MTKLCGDKKVVASIAGKVEADVHKDACSYERCVNAASYTTEEALKHFKYMESEAERGGMVAALFKFPSGRDFSRDQSRQYKMHS